MWFGVVWWWFGASMANQSNKNALKFLLQLLILSQKHILCVKKVFWDGLDVVWGGLEVVWGVLGWFGVFPRTAQKMHTQDERRIPKLLCMAKIEIQNILTVKKPPTFYRIM